MLYVGVAVIGAVVDGFVVTLQIVSDNLSDVLELFKLSTFHIAFVVPFVFVSEFLSNTSCCAPCRLSELFHVPIVLLYPIDDKGPFIMAPAAFNDVV